MSTDSMTLSERAEIVAVLNAAFSKRYHSLAQYIAEAKPYVPKGQEALQITIRQIAAEDRAEAERIADVIEGLEEIPQVEPYDPDIAKMNYLSIVYLKKILMAELEKELPWLEKMAEKAAFHPTARNALQSLARKRRSQIARMRLL